MMTTNEIVTLLLGMILGISTAIGIMTIKWEHHNTIVKQGCGQYNNQTGDFEFIKQEK